MLWVGSIYSLITPRARFTWWLYRRPNLAVGLLAWLSVLLTESDAERVQSDDTDIWLKLVWFNTQVIYWIIFIVNSIEVTFEIYNFDLAIFADGILPFNRCHFAIWGNSPQCNLVRHQNMSPAKHAAFKKSEDIPLSSWWNHWRGLIWWRFVFEWVYK